MPTRFFSYCDLGLIELKGALKIGCHVFSGARSLTNGLISFSDQSELKVCSDSLKNANLRFSSVLLSQLTLPDHGAFYFNGGILIDSLNSEEKKERLQQALVDLPLSWRRCFTVVVPEYKPEWNLDGLRSIELSCTNDHDLWYQLIRVPGSLEHRIVSRPECYLDQKAYYCQIQCDEMFVMVDWFLMAMLPKMTQHSDAQSLAGQLFRVLTLVVRSGLLSLIYPNYHIKANCTLPASFPRGRFFQAYQWCHRSPFDAESEIMSAYQGDAGMEALTQVSLEMRREFDFIQGRP